MGRFVAQIGGYTAEYSDYQRDYIKQGQDRDYYDKKKIEIEVSNGIERYTIEVPITEFVVVEKLRTKYHYDFISGNTLGHWLIDHINGRGKNILCVVELNVIRDRIYDKDSKILDYPVEGYYLQSEIGDDDIVIGTTPQKHCIKDYEQIKWLSDRMMYVK